MSWQRGCKIMVNQTIGCSQHKWFHDGKEQTVDECICKNNLCNKDIQPIPETTTPKGILFFHIAQFEIKYVKQDFIS